MNSEGRNQHLLESYVNEAITEVLTEDDDGGGYGYGDGGDYYGGGGGGGYGYGGGGEGGLYNTFIRPFVDVVQTGKYAIKAMAATTKSLLKQVLVSIPALILPFVKADFDKIRQKEEQEIGTIKGKYADVLKRNMDMLRDHDLWGVAFMLDPSLMFGAKAVQYAPGVIKDLLEMVGINVGHSSGKHQFEGRQRLREADESLQGLVANQQVIEHVKQKLATHPDVVAVRTRILNDFLDRAKEVMSSKTLEEFVAKTGTKIPQMNVIPKDLPTFQNGVLTALKAQYRDNYVKYLTDIGTKASGAKDQIQQTVKAIQALK